VVAGGAKWISFVILVLSIESGNAADIIGAGAHTCEEVSQAWQNDPRGTELTLTQWSLGFISATNLSMPNAKHRFDLGAMRPNDVVKKLRDFCAQKPKAEFYEAVDALMMSLPEKAQ
jgi:hypothetical protein